MRRILEIIILPLALDLLAPACARAAEPIVSNVIASQRPNSKLVDITYTLAYSGTSKVEVSVEISSDAGATFEVPAESLSGAVGRSAGIAAGSGLQITWNAGADWNQRFTRDAMVRLHAAEYAPPALDGFVLIPAGSFSMGDSVDGREVPVHTVQVSAFHMAKYEVTKALWDEVRAWGLTHNYTDLAVGSMSGTTNLSKGVTHPVHLVTWYDMVKWCNARSVKEGLTPCYTLSGAVYMTTNNDAVVCNWAADGYRLPTEAEWEKAARGGVSGARYSWGTNTISHSQANYYAGGTAYGNVSLGYHPTYAVNGTPYTAPVGSFAANGYGLYDMAGNIWEKCWDWYGSYASGTQTDPRGAASGSDRVDRGGSWFNFFVYDCRVAYRSSSEPSNSANCVGFRLARSYVP